MKVQSEDPKPRSVLLWLAVALLGAASRSIGASRSTAFGL